MAESTFHYPVPRDIDAKTLQLPDLMTTLAGERITSVERWRAVRQPEILELFRKHEYGRNPAAVDHPEGLRFEVQSSAVMDGEATRKLVTIRFAGPRGEGRLPATVYVPNRRGGPVGAFVLISFDHPHRLDPANNPVNPAWPYEMLIRRGYALAAFYMDDVAPDQRHDFTTSVHAIFETPGTPRAADAWGTVAAWAWGASRVMDYLLSDRDIDPRRIGVIGHSRAGKAALWCGAQDERFGMVVSNDSGCSGAAIARGKVKGGETVGRINTVFPHWFCENYKQYNDREDAMPMDQHMLVAAVAPRLAYLASALDDVWADPPGEFAACLHAQRAWELYGLPGLGAAEMPPLDSPLQSGRIGYHIREGKHELAEFDWKAYLDFADRHMRGSERAGAAKAEDTPLPRTGSLPGRCLPCCRLR